jgi:hypothetical protein
MPGIKMAQQTDLKMIMLRRAMKPKGHLLLEGAIQIGTTLLNLLLQSEHAQVPG